MEGFLLNDFEKIFNNSNGIEVFFAPGRVNLIGEHTDYNGGYVFPCALTFGTYAVGRRIEKPVARLYSKNFESLGIVEFDIRNLKYEIKHDWANYPKGVVYQFLKNDYSFNGGFEVLYYGNIPNGAGLSSSASIELATAVLLKELFSLEIGMIDIVKLCKAAENEFIGVNCGIMDQFAIGMGKKDYAILLDTNTLEYEYVMAKLNGASIVISNTNKRRGLFGSEYNDRRRQCEKALIDMQREFSINSLGKLDEDTFERNKHLIKDEIILKRARHAVYENRRTLKAVDALKKNDIEKFGKLMNESHISLRDDFEVTGKELDTLVELAWNQKGVIGSRMTGAGFGGCTVSIISDEYIDSFVKNVGEKYEKKIGYKASFYTASIGQGARKLNAQEISKHFAL